MNPKSLQRHHRADSFLCLTNRVPLMPPCTTDKGRVIFTRLAFQPSSRSKVRWVEWLGYIEQEHSIRGTLVVQKYYLEYPFRFRVRTVPECFDDRCCRSRLGCLSTDWYRSCCQTT
jgi:hypothetical protein